MKCAVRIADRHEVTLAFEPEMHNVVNSVSKARRLLDEIDSPWLKVVIDPANLVHSADMSRIGEIFEEAFDWLGSDIILAHAKSPPNLMDAGQLLSLNRVAARFVRPRRSERLPERSNEPIPEPLDLYFFFCDYLTWLRKIVFAGPLIIHGLAEDLVTQMKNFLSGELSLLDRK